MSDSFIDNMPDLSINVHTSRRHAGMLLASKMTNPFYQGIFLYRAAKLYYYKNDEENCRKLLGEAMEKLKGTAWEVMIRQMLEENLALVAER